MNEGISASRASYGGTPGNGQTGEAGWTIGDGSLWRTDETASWNDTTDSRVIVIRGTVAAASTDATLSALGVEDGGGGGIAFALSPQFSSSATSYAASVPNRADRITIDPTKNDDDATFVFLDGSDTQLTDADTGEDKFQVDLDVGANTVKVKVTAEDNNTTQTYTVVVTREAAATGYEVWGSTITIGLNSEWYGYCEAGAGDLACDSNFGSLSQYRRNCVGRQGLCGRGCQVGPPRRIRGPA